MALVTGTPAGTITQQDEIYIEGAPYVYYQDYDGPLIVDGDSFYWGLSGTVTYPVFQLACYEDVSLGSDVTVNAGIHAHALKSAPAYCASAHFAG